MAEDEVVVQAELSREERDAKGFRNAIVISDSDDEGASSRPAAAVKKAGPSSSGASSSNSAGKRPATADPDDVKPDVKQIKPAPAPIPQAYQQFGALQPTDLEDLSFANAVKFAHGRGPAAPRRAGSLMVSLSAHGGPADPPVLIGTGREATSVQLLDVLPYEVTLTDGTHGNQLFGAIRRLADPRNTAPSRYRQGQPLVHVEWQPALPWRLKRNQPPVKVQLDVWLMPGIFDLRISTWHSCASCFYDIWLLFDKMTPMAPFIEPPRPPPVRGEVALAPCGAASASRPSSAAAPKATAHSFTLAGLMRAMESAGYDEMVDPPGLQLTLYPYQRQSLQWMFDRETQAGGLNALFWREYPSDKGGGDDHTYWYNPMAGELRDHKLPMVTGGFLCEEMGLGKTVEMCALVLANPYTARASAAGRAMVRRSAGASPPTPTKATLVVCPVVLLNQWKAEIFKIAGKRLKVYIHHSDAARKESNKDLTPFLDADIVLTTYEVLRAEVPWQWSFRAILRMHWWRVVLDESQKVPKPTNERSAMTAIAKACLDLSRTHTWCMSGTPVGSVVDDLLGQLIVLGVEPYCSRGDNGDAFWEREVTERWKSRDKDALEVVHDLLGQIMMRHSKGQTMVSADGQRTALVELPAKTEEVMLVPLADASERVVYGELERMSREDFLAGGAAKAALAKAIANGSDPKRVDKLRKVAQQFRRDDLVSPRDLQHVATHVSALNLDKDTGIERKLAVRDARTGAKQAAAASAAPHTVFGPMLLRDAAAAATGGAAARLHALLSKPDAHRCGICKGSFRANDGGAAGSSSDEAPCRLVPRLTPCGHLFCQSCLGNSTQQRGDECCPECFAPDAGLRSAMLLATPLDAASLDETDTAATEPSLPAVETSAWEITTPPPVAQLRELRVWSCDGQPCHDDMAGNNGALAAAKKAKNSAMKQALAQGATRAAAIRAGNDAEATHLQYVGFAGNGKKERQVTLDVDGMHFCSQVCAEAKFKRALIKENGLLVVGDEWDGDKLNGQQFPNQSQAIKALKDVIRDEPSYATGTQWAGDALYPSLQRCQPCTSNSFTDAESNGRSQRLPSLAKFPAEAPGGAFLAHLDAAGGPRSYGMHFPTHTGSKAEAALKEIERVHAAGEKIVVFSDCKPVLEVLHDAIRRKLGDGSVAFIFGDTGFENRMQALRRFHENAGCYTLLLSVGACASGLTLTVANHCLLLDLQSHEGRELQLINRIWRIGQTRPVSVKRMVAAGTIEERMLHLRKRSKGLMATESDADTMAVSRVDEGVESSTAEQSERTEELRYLLKATA